MKLRILPSLFSLFLVFSMLSTLTTCAEREETVSCFPSSAISVTLNLNLPAYYMLQNTGSWMYIDQEGAGTRGLIVVRVSSGFKVYDRNAPHICPDENTTLKVVDDIKIVCPADNAEWILITGQPTAVSKVAPKTYSYTYDSSSKTLTIYN
ncbi:hypothetical protein [Daejeonia sp. YH14]|uniref:hypothetical protein n=1 Tax=Daejeonia sp. YH14 TaxID=3439042 RepID=UPI003F4991AB